MFKIRQLLFNRIRSFRFNRLVYSPGLSEILSHSELIPDAALTLTYKRYRYNEIKSQLRFEPRTCRIPL